MKECERSLRAFFTPTRDPMIWRGQNHWFGLGSHKNKHTNIGEPHGLNLIKNQWVLVDGKRIIWLCGLRISDEVKITDKSTDYAKLMFKQ